MGKVFRDWRHDLRGPCPDVGLDHPAKDLQAGESEEGNQKEGESDYHCEPVLADFGTERFVKATVRGNGLMLGNYPALCWSSNHLPCTSVGPSCLLNPCP